MDMEGFVGSSSGSGSLMFTSPMVSSDNEAWRNRDLLGSGFLKQGRSGGFEEQDWRCAKMARTESALMPAAAKSSLLRSNSSTLFLEGQQMLSFSSPKQEGLMLCNDGSLPYHHLSSSALSSSSSASYVRSSGLGSGSLNMDMHGVLAGVKGAFTPSQWLELEHQAIIYKCIAANIPIPPSLLVSIHKSLNRTGYSGYSAASLRQSAFGWGSFQLGFSGSSDPEPGRCRRTDGKKWRCSRDAVVDQKYCERHLNRGRHRSRKPVEGQSGHGKVTSAITSLPAASSVSGKELSNGIATNQQETNSSRSGASGPSTVPFNRSPINKENMNDSQNLSLLTSMNQGLETTQINFLKQQDPFEESTHKAEIGLISSDSILNTSRRSYLENTNFSLSPKTTDRDPPPNPFRHFMDTWSRNQSDRSTITWPDAEDAQLSISIPKPSSDFSRSSSPSRGKMTLSPLKQSQESEPIHMGLGVGGNRQASWTPISWEASMGGPLGEVLNNSSKDTSINSNTTLNLINYGWNSDPRPDSSPTGVLQKTAFGSLSGSTGSSPQAGSLCDDLSQIQPLSPLCELHRRK